MLIQTYKLTLTEEVLGASSSNKQIHRDYVAAKVVDAAKKGKRQTIIHGRVTDVPEGEAEALRDEEVAAISAAETEQKALTVFPRMAVGDDTDVPFLFDYQGKGFLKDSAKMLRKVSGSACSKVKAYRQAIDGQIFIVEPEGDGMRPTMRQIPFMAPDGAPAHVSGICERPLRASTAQGERIALASSETVPAGSTLTFGVLVLVDSLMPMVSECMSYGALRGLLQWRNSGKGAFIAEKIGKPVKVSGFGSN